MTDIILQVGGGEQLRWGKDGVYREPLSSCSSPSACSASTSSKQDGPNDGERLWENMTLEERKAQIDKCLDATNALANRVVAERAPFPAADYVPPPTNQPDECMPNEELKLRSERSERR